MNHFGLTLGLFAAALSGSGSLNAQVLPTPEGQYAVGYWTTSLQRQVPSREGRTLLIEAWYPAEGTPGDGDKPYASSWMAGVLREQFGLSETWHADVRTHARRDAVPRRGLHGVVVMSHGLSWPPTLYQSFAEDLASRGYVVLAVSHPHGAPIDFGSGRVLGVTPLPQTESEAHRDSLLARLRVTWSEDLRSVLARLDTWAAGPEATPLAGIIDPKRVALLAHSFGGSAIAHLSNVPGVRALVLLEGKLRDSSATQISMSAPLLHVIGEYNRLELEGRSYLPGESAPVYQLILGGTGHAYFSDLILIYKRTASADWLSRHRYELEPARVVQITRDYIAAFVGRYLDGKDNSLLHPVSYAARVRGPRAAGYSEVELTIDIK
jgi:dienelactone hydrolase